MSQRKSRIATFLRCALVFAVAGTIAACASGSSSGDDEPGPEEGEAGSGGTTDGEGGSGGSGKSGSAGASGSSGSAGASGSGGSAGSGSAGFPSNGDKGEFGTPCAGSADCNSNLCMDVGNPQSSLNVCVQECETGVPCPSGSHCVVNGDLPVCVPDRDSLCGGCKFDNDCLNRGDRCVAGAGDEKFCAQDCSFDGACPENYECKKGPGSSKLCYPSGGVACACASNRNGATRPCTKVSQGVTCGGVETCDAAVGEYVGCNAPDPAPETCNGLDDNCDGLIDNLPHASCICNGAGCTISCEQGFSRYPVDGPDVDGCSCAIDAGEPTAGGSCGSALSVSKIADTGAKTETTLIGTLSSDSDVDWYKVPVSDTTEAGANSLHLRVTFEENANDEFVFTIFRNDCNGLSPGKLLTSYDYCMNYKETLLTGAVRGQSPCGVAAGLNHCDGAEYTFYISVQRNPDATKKTCEPYKLRVQAAAGPCDTSTFDGCEESPLARLSAVRNERGPDAFAGVGAAVFHTPSARPRAP